jgi:hypothetical protein
MMSQVLHNHWEERCSKLRYIFEFLNFGTQSYLREVLTERRMTASEVQPRVSSLPVVQSLTVTILFVVVSRVMSFDVCVIVVGVVVVAVVVNFWYKTDYCDLVLINYWVVELVSDSY